MGVSMRAKQLGRMERAMTGMKIDMEIIQDWVRNWENEWRGNKKASQIAAVMLSKALAENEARASRVEQLMNEIIEEGNILNRIEKKVAPSRDARGSTEAALLEECQKHKKRMAAILREADMLLKEKSEDQTIQVGGLLLEIGRQKLPCGEETQRDRPPSPTART